MYSWGNTRFPASGGEHLPIMMQVLCYNFALTDMQQPLSHSSCTGGGRTVVCEATLWCHCCSRCTREMQVLAEVVALHQTSGITAAQAKACAAMAISKLASIIHSQGSAVQHAPAATPGLKPGAFTRGQASPVTPKLILSRATPKQKDAAIPARADAKGQVSPGRNICNGAGHGWHPLQPCTLRDCTHQLALLLQYASLHVLGAASACPSGSWLRLATPQYVSECIPLPPPPPPQAVASSCLEICWCLQLLNFRLSYIGVT